VKFWVGMLLVSPVWGWVSTQMFLQGWLSVVGIACGLAGLVRGRVPRLQNLTGIGVGVVSVILWSALLRGGFWLLVDVLKFGYSGAENTVYWLVAGIFALGSLQQMVTSVRNSWRFAMVPGALDQFTLDRRIDAAYRKAAA
jgi:hypothetical protein